MNYDLFKSVMEEYYCLRQKGDPSFSLDFLPFEFSIKSTNAIDFIWSMRQEEFTRTLISDFNIFINNLYKLYLLNKIIEKYNSREQEILMFEFTTTLLYFCLHQPNEYRNRVIFFCTHLCHEANVRILSNYQDSLEKDSSINFKSLKRSSKYWQSSDSLITSLELIGNRNRSFQEATNDYRNRNQHQLPPSLEMGLTNTIKRMESLDKCMPHDIGFLSSDSFFGAEFETKDSVVYSIGSEKPLKSRDLLPTLIQQGQSMKEVFYRYWEIVKEQENSFLVKSQ